MADTKLSALPVVTTPTLADLLYAVQGGASSQITLGNLLANVPSVAFANPHAFPSITLTSPLTPANGGSGIANNDAATLTRSGNFALTLTLTGITNVTLPTSGTLLTSAGAVTSIAGTANQITASAAVGAVTLSLPNAVAINLGATTPPTPFTVGDTSSTTPRGLMSWQSSNDTSSAHLHMRKSRGTFAVPLTVAAADILGRVVYGGYDGTNYLEMASVRATVVGTVAATRIPTKIELMTGTDAAPSVLTVALTLDQNQAATFAGAIIGTATQSLLNTVSTTVNFAGAATTLAMGAGAAASATLSFTTAIALNTAAITSNQATVALLNATPTTINAFGAATAINIGAATALSTFLGQIGVTGGTVTTSKPVLTATQTWNAGAVTFTGMLLNVTDTASAAASLLVDFQVATVSQWKVSKSGAVVQVGGLTLPNGTSSIPSINFGDATSGWYRGSSTAITAAISGSPTLLLNATQLRISSGTIFGFASATDVVNNAADVILARDAANILAQRNGTNAQGHLLYNTLISAGNAEYLSMQWATNVCTIKTAAIGTGTLRGLNIGGATSDLIGFYGVTPIARAILATGGGATADNIITALQNLGLVRQS